MLRKPVALASLVGALALGGLPATATAAPTLTLSTGSDPAESIPTQILIGGTATSGKTVLGVTLKSAGGQGCGANFSADGGTTVDSPSTLSEGPFTKSVDHTFNSAGSYLLCGWLTDDAQAGEPVVATASLAFDVRQPHLALALSAPAVVQPEQTFQILTTAQAEVARTFSEFIVPNTNRGCPANASAADNTSGEQGVYFAAHGTGWSVDGGPFTESANVVLRSVGQYLVCAYAQYPTSETPPEISATATVTVVTPPPPCVVPRFTSTTRLKALQGAIKAAGCTVGKIRRAANRRVRSGYVLGVSPAPGTRRAAGTPINITVSTGPPCVVPKISAGTALGTAERRLRQAHCATGKLRSARSRRYRRGHVMRLGTHPGSVLPSYAPVEITVSSGRSSHH
jgi:hypothetical protein